MAADDEEAAGGHGLPTEGSRLVGILQRASGGGRVVPTSALPKTPWKFRQKNAQVASTCSILQMS